MKIEESIGPDSGICITLRKKLRGDMLLPLPLSMNIG